MIINAIIKPTVYGKKECCDLKDYAPLFGDKNSGLVFCHYCGARFEIVSKIAPLENGEIIDYESLDYGPV